MIVYISESGDYAVLPSFVVDPGDFATRVVTAYRVIRSGITKAGSVVVEKGLRESAVPSKRVFDDLLPNELPSDSWEGEDSDAWEGEDDEDLFDELYGRDSVAERLAEFAEFEDDASEASDGLWT